MAKSVTPQEMAMLLNQQMGTPAAADGINGELPWR